MVNGDPNGGRRVDPEATAAPRTGPIRPGLSIFPLLSSNLPGDGLRDALDPRRR